MGILKSKLFLLVILVLVLGLGYFGYLEPIRNVLTDPRLTLELKGVSISLWEVLKVLLVIFAFFWFALQLSAAAQRYIRKLSKIRTSNQILFVKLAQILIYTTFFFLSLDILGIDLTIFAIFGGAVGIGIGFGIQKIASNFISGLILMLEKSVRVDDLIELDDGTLGLVIRTGGRSTHLRTFEGRDVMVPNEDFITSRITNWTLVDQLGRIDIKVGVAYGTDLELARRCILDAAQTHPRCVTSPEANCYLSEYGDSSIEFYLLFWVDEITTGRLQPRSDVMMQIWKNFQDNDIVIPFPQRDVWLKEPKKET